jgi:hypothetical protein
LVNPAVEQLDEIEKWLIEERDGAKEGFYCNWSIIKAAFTRKSFAVITAGKRPLAL